MSYNPSQPRPDFYGGSRSSICLRGETRTATVGLSGLFFRTWIRQDQTITTTIQAGFNLL